MRWFQALMPKEDKFFDMFEAHTVTLNAGAAALRRLLDGGPDVPAHCGEIAGQEQKADDITRDVMLAVRRTFITPFDRGDIRDLISSMDDAIDQMHKTAKTITLFEVRQFEPSMPVLGDVIVKMAELTGQAIPLLRSMHGNAGELNTLTEQIVQLEEQSDQLCDQGLAALYKGPGQADPMRFIVGSEIYDHLEKVADRFEDVANRINSVLIEHL